MQAVERRLARTDLEARPLGLIMLDLDDFKDVNDRLGHLGGDGVLEAVGRHRPGRLFGTVLLGHHDGQDQPSASLSRAVPSKAERVTWLEV